MAFKRILIGLDFSLMDKTLIRYAAFLAQHTQPEKIFFLHVDSTPKIPEEILKDFPQLGLPQDEYIMEQLNLEVNENFVNHQSFDITTDVVQWMPINGIMKYVTEKHIDLLVLGFKHELPGNGILTSRLLENVNCSVLFVPEKARSKLNEVVVCTDFTMFSKSALSYAYELVGNSEDATINCLHVYGIPRHMGVEAADLGDAIKEHAGQRYNEFISDIAPQAHLPRPLFVPMEGRPLGYNIVKAAERLNADLLVLGGRGRSWAVSYMEGSTPQMLLRTESDIPFLVIKNHTNNYDIDEPKAVSASSN